MRYEKKYLINSEQYNLLTEKIADLFSPDEFGRSVIMNIYFDNLRSIERNVFFAT